MIKTIKFKNETASKGRNGIIKTSGVEVMSSSYGVMVSPITSKGQPSDSCFVEIDADAIVETVLAIVQVGIGEREYSERFNQMKDGDYSNASEFEEYFVTAWAVTTREDRIKMEAMFPEIFFDSDDEGIDLESSAFDIIERNFTPE